MNGGENSDHPQMSHCVYLAPALAFMLELGSVIHASVCSANIVIVLVVTRGKLNSSKQVKVVAMPLPRLHGESAY